MGCDIHMYTEIYYDGKWRNCDYFATNLSSRDEYRNMIPIYDNRNYALFATLANVRNYGNTDYISEPKGLPKDISDFVAEEYENDFDTHSASYLTLRELIDFHEQHHPLKRRGMLSPKQIEDLNNGILPDTWCQGTNAKGFEFREWKEENDILVPLINKLKDRANDLNFIYDFSWDGNVDARRRAYNKSKDIRIVFWFDN